MPWRPRSRSSRRRGVNPGRGRRARGARRTRAATAGTPPRRPRGRRRSPARRPQRGPPRRPPPSPPSTGGRAGWFSAARGRSTHVLHCAERTWRSLRLGKKRKVSGRPACSAMRTSCRSQRALTLCTAACTLTTSRAPRAAAASATTGTAAALLLRLAHAQPAGRPWPGGAAGSSPGKCAALARSNAASDLGFGRIVV
jgi:hypothetical protein